MAVMPILKEASCSGLNAIRPFLIKIYDEPQAIARPAKTNHARIGISAFV